MVKGGYAHAEEGTYSLLLNNRVSFWVVQDSRNDKSPHLRVEHKYDLQTLQYWKEACKVKKRGGQ